MTYEDILAKYSTILRGIPECGDGWLPIIDECLGNIYPIILKYREENGQPIEDGSMMVVQIKEKYGGLRIYFSSQLEEFDQFLNEAERKSWITCEWCGQPGVLRRRGWASVSCDICDHLKHHI